MGTMRKAPLVIGGTVAGIVAVGYLHKRRSNSTDEEPQEEEQGPETATERAKAAVEQTRQVAQKTKARSPRITR